MTPEGPMLWYVNRGTGLVLLVLLTLTVVLGIALVSIVAVLCCHLARAVAPADMKEALLREGRHPAAGTTFGHVHGEETLLTDAAGRRGETPLRESPDPSSVDEVGRPGVPHNHGEGTHNR